MLAHLGAMLAYLEGKEQEGKRLRRQEKNRAGGQEGKRQEDKRARG